MARRKIVMLVAGLVALCGILAVGLGGCKDLTFNGDMKGYLEYWTATLGVSNPQVSEGYQMDSSGRMTISTGESVTVTATIENPDGHTVNGGVGPSSDILKSVRISGAAGDIALSSGPRVTASLTSLTLELPPLSPVPTEETRRAEHKEFTVLLAPVRTETNMSPSNPLSLTFRYNTPPRMPLAVMEDGGSFRWPRDGDRWEVSGGSICWAWPKDKTRAGGGSATDPDYVEWFYIDDGVTNKREKEAGLLQPGQTLNKDGMEYNVYKATGLAQTASVKVYAEDGDRVRGQAAVSGEIRTITLYGNGGTFGSSSTATMYAGDGSTIKAGDLETPTYTGLSLSGWSDQPSGGQSFTFPHTVSANLTLHAQWRGNSYTVTFDDGSGTGGPGSLTAAYNQTPPPLPSRPARAGYTFGGYFTEKNGGGTEYYDGSGAPQGIWKEPQPTTLYAKWTANKYTVKFDGNDKDGGSMSDQTFTYDQLQSLTNNQFTRTDHEFVGWNTVANGTGDSYENGQSVSNLTTNLNGSVTLYAQWAALVSGSGGASSEAVNYIKNLASAAPGIYTVKVTGSLSSSDVPTIRDALIAAGGNVKVRLDLSSVTGLTAIPQYAFNSTNGGDGSTRAGNLVWIRLPDTVTSIGKCAFDCLTQLKYVDLGSGVTSIDREVFDYCYSLTTIRVSANPPPSWGSSSPFRMQGGQAGYAQRTVEVPSGLLNTYQGSGWASLPKATLTGY